MPAGSSPRREAEYRKLEHRFKQEERYKGREEEVASRIVNKQRSQYGETQEEQQKDREGRSPDRGLLIEGYQTLTIPQIRRQLHGLSRAEIQKIRRYEAAHKNRKGVLAALDARLK